MRQPPDIIALTLLGLLTGCASPIPPAVPLNLPVAPQRPFVAGDPPIVPFRETIVRDDGAFEKECMKGLMSVPQNLGWVFGDKLLTQTKDMAFIWRGDYKTPRDPHPKHWNRVICSVMKNGALDIQIALDQKIERLSVAAEDLQKGGS